MSAATTEPVRVLVVDDSPALREATRDLLEATAGFQWIGDACCGEDGVQQAVRLLPDLVLMDVRMPGIGGLEAARRIAGQASAPTLVLITAEEVADAVPDWPAALVLCKHRLSGAALRRLWQDHGGDPAEPQA